MSGGLIYAIDRGTKFTLRRRYDAVKLKLVDLAKDEKGLEAYKTEQKQHVEEMEEVCLLSCTPVRSPTLKTSICIVHQTVQQLV